MKLIARIPGFTEASAQPVIDHIAHRAATEHPFQIKPILPGRIVFRSGAEQLTKSFDAIPETYGSVNSAEFKVSEGSHTAMLVLDVDGDEALLKAVSEHPELEIHLVADISVDTDSAGIPIPVVNDAIGFGVSLFYGEGSVSANFDNFGVAAYPADVWALLEMRQPTKADDKDAAENIGRHITMWKVVDGMGTDYQTVDSLTYNIAGILKNITVGSGITDEDLKSVLKNIHDHM